MSGGSPFLVLAAYLLGSIPFGLLLGRLRGVDPRGVGSGNIGATNMMRAGGKAAGLATFALDAAKGAAGPAAAMGLGAGSGWASLAGLAAVLGHCFPIYLRFRGGKGVATLFGAFLALDPVAAAGGAVLFAISLAWLRYVAVSSQLLALALVAGAGLRHGAADPRALMALASAALVAWTHRSNWRRMLAGAEGRAFERSGPGDGGAHG